MVEVVAAVSVQPVMSHVNAELTPKARLRLARLIVDEHWAVSEAAKMFMVSWPTAKGWAVRYAELGEAGMDDRSSRPHLCLGHHPVGRVVRCR